MTSKRLSVRRKQKGGSSEYVFTLTEEEEMPYRGFALSRAARRNR